uniref:Uncharacterized protein n=1 Tax=Meloidogyne hapla TaxID=6305 RepID=A0A1I8BUL4_MELHA
MKFSFFELSILINILNKFNLKDIVNDQKHDLNEIFSEYISQHTAKSEQIVGKLKEICVYYDVMLDQLPKANFNTDENDIKLDIIKYRLKTLINEHKYNILERWGIIVNHGLSDEEKCSEAFEQLETFR